MNNQEQWISLNRFEANIGCLDEIKEWSDQLDIFDVLKISHRELQHSNMLAWLLDPKRNHGLHGLFLQSVLKEVLKVPVEKVDPCIVYREYHNIDILIVINDPRTVLCIENKIYSGENGDQLKTYREYLELAFSEYNRYFLFLTPEGVEPSDPSWSNVSYQSVIDLLEPCLHKAKIDDERRFFISNYINTLRRRIMKDSKELEEKCMKIYQEHQDALELIFEYRPSPEKATRDAIMTWCERKAKNNNDFIYDKSFSDRKMIRFRTVAMSDLMPDYTESKSYWGIIGENRYMYFYEISSEGGMDFQTIHIQISVYHDEPKDTSFCEIIQEKAFDQFSGYILKRKKLLGTRVYDKKWYTAKASMDHKLSGESHLEDGYSEYVWSELDRMLAELKEFEDKVASSFKDEF